MSDHSRNHGNLKSKGNTASEKRCSLQCFDNAWYECFFIHHDFTGKDDVSAVDVKKKIWGSVEDDLTIFLDICNDLGSPCEVDEIRRYCEGCTILGEEQDGIGKDESRRGIWIDDRNNPELIGKGATRICGNFSTVGLLKHLKQPRFKLENVPDAERRLIHIPNLTPEVILAIAATASFQQVPAVRDAICKHVTSRPSIQVHVPSDGKPTFQLEFHIPFFALRRAPQTDTPHPSVRSRRLRSWEDVTFVTRDNTGSESQESYRLHRAQISFVIHGFDEWNWTAWAFEDTDHEMQESDDLAADAGVGDDEAGLIEDPIAYGLDANDPIWRPREYFVKVLEIRIKKVREEWDELVHMLQHDRNENKQLQPFTYSKSRRARSGRTEEMNESFKWTRGRLNLVTELLVVLLGIIHEWDRFLSPDGDWGYFSDLDRSPSHTREFNEVGQSIRSINRAFKRLENNRQRLLSMKETLSDDLSTLKLLLSLEGNAATESSAFMSKFTIWVLCPYSLSVGMFSMQPSVIPFQLTFTWFVITMMIMMFAIFAIQWLMRRWTLLHSHVLWVKLKKVIEQHQEETALGTEQKDRVPDVLRDSGGIDLARDAPKLQTMRAKTLSSRANSSPV